VPHHQPPEEPSGVVLIDVDDEVYAALLAHRDALTRAARRAVSFGETIQHLIDNSPTAQQVLTGHAHPSGSQTTSGASGASPDPGRTGTPAAQDGGDRRRTPAGNGDGHPPAP
jgi:hypothetical protein